MPDINLTTACKLLRDEYFQIALTKNRSKKHSEDKLNEIKAFHLKIAQQQKHSAKEQLFIIQFQLIQWENESYNQPTQDKLNSMKEELESLRATIDSDECTPLSPAAEKWKKTEPRKRSFIQSLTVRKVSVSKEKTLVEELLKKVNNRLSIIDENRRKEDAMILESLQINEDKMDLAFLVDSILLFYNQCRLSNRDDFENNLQRYKEKIQFQLELLTLEELKHVLEQMSKPNFVSLLHAFYAQSYLFSQQNDIDNLSEQPQYKNALAVLSNASTTLQMKNLATRDNSRSIFLSSVNQVYTLFLNFHSHVQDEVEKRTGKKSKKNSPFLTDWPKDSNETPVTITSSVEEETIIMNAVHSLLSPKQNTSLERMDTLPTVASSPEKILPKENRYSTGSYKHSFAKILRAFGCFNPSKFINKLYNFMNDRTRTKHRVEKLNDRMIYKFYKKFIGEDLNHFVFLLGQIKHGDQKSISTLCEWLSIERTMPVSKFNDNFQKIAGDLYDTAHDYMQFIRFEILKRRADSKKYQRFSKVSEDFLENGFPYNHLDLTDKALSNKNAATIKQWLTQKYPDPEDYTIKKTWIDKLYYAVYPLDQLQKEEKSIQKKSSIRDVLTQASSDAYTLIMSPDSIATEFIETPTGLNATIV